MKTPTEGCYGESRVGRWQQRPFIHGIVTQFTNAHGRIARDPRKQHETERRNKETHVERPYCAHGYGDGAAAEGKEMPGMARESSTARADVERSEKERRKSPSSASSRRDASDCVQNTNYAIAAIEGPYGLRMDDVTHNLPW